MIAVVTLLLAAPLGYRVRSRLAAHTVYVLAYLWAFTFQTLYLLLDSLPGTTNPAPPFVGGGFPLAYGLVALAVLAVGCGLIEGARWAGMWRQARAQIGQRAAAA